MKENKGFNKLVNKFSDIIYTSYFSSNSELAFHSDEICADLAKQIAIEYAAKVCYMSLHPELNDEKWNGLFTRETAYTTILNNFDDAVDEYEF